MTFQTSLLIPLIAVPLWTGSAQTPPQRICLAPSEAQMAYRNTEQAIAAVRETFASYLTGPGLTNTPLTARLASQIRAEAKQAECAYVLFTSVKQEHKTGNGILGRVAGSAVEAGAWQATTTTTSVAARVIATSAASGVATSIWAQSVKAKDELTLAYRLESGDGVVLTQRTDKRKAKSDGEDLLSPLVRSASEAVVATVTKQSR